MQHSILSILVCDSRFSPYWSVGQNAFQPSRTPQRWQNLPLPPARQHQLSVLSLASTLRHERMDPTTGADEQDQTLGSHSTGSLWDANTVQRLEAQARSHVAQMPLRLPPLPNSRGVISWPREPRWKFHIQALLRICDSACPPIHLKVGVDRAAVGHSVSRIIEVTSNKHRTPTSRTPDLACRFDF